MKVISARTPGRPKRTDSEKLVGHILSCAASLFIEQGYASTSVEQIARSAGADKQTLYRRFGPKGDLFVAACLYEIELHMRVSGLEQSPTAPGTVEAIRQWCRSALIALLSPRAVRICRVAYAEAHRFPDLGEAVNKASIERVLSPLVALVGKGQAAGEVLPGDPYMLAQQALNACMANRLFNAMLGGRELEDVASREDWFERSWPSVRRLLTQR